MRSQLTLVVIFLVGAIASIVFYQLYYTYFFPHCELKEVKNRRFESYFGIQKNLFYSLNADVESCDNFYQGHVQGELLRKTSYIVYGLKGSGKSTTLRCHKSKVHKIVSLTHHRVKRQMEAFAVSVNENGKKMNVSEAIAAEWQDTDFIHGFLSAAVSDVILEFGRNKQIFAKVLEKMGKGEKVAIVDIFCMYIDDPNDLQVLADLINLFLSNGWDFFGRKVDPKKNVDLDKGIERKDAFKAIKIRPLILPAVSICIQAHEITEAKYSNASDPYSQLVAMNRFISMYSNLKPAIEIDGLDEIYQIFNGNDVAYKALEKYVLSATSLNLVSMMTSNELYWFYSFPGENVDYGKIFTENRKFPTDKLAYVALNYSSQQLRNYADFLLDVMRHKQSVFACAKLPTFSELVNFPASADILAKLRNPRDMNIFMQNLFILLNTNAQETNYLATTNIVEEAMKKAQQQMFNPALEDVREEEV